jgi:truncated hemoglobin YjbI
MGQALADMGLDEGLQQELNQAFFRTADFMRNRPETAQNNPFKVMPYAKR